MPTLTIVDSLSLPGSSARPNEDAMGWTDDCAFVIDGATGLGPDFVVGRYDSDAAWLAAFSKIHFEEMIRPGLSMRDIVCSTNALARRIVTFASKERDIPKWNLPVAGFQMIRIEGDAIVTYGLGDCSLYVLGSDGVVSSHSAMPEQAEREKAEAGSLISAAGALTGGGRLVDNPDFVARERRIRAAYNSDASGVWTLGTSPEAADHLMTAQLDAPRPVRGLLCSDGFAALIANYGKYDPKSLVENALGEGLEKLGIQLRDVECREDPGGQIYPRVKQSDDATALLFEIA
jgi:hypothetical protein